MDDETILMYRKYKENLKKEIDQREREIWELIEEHNRIDELLKNKI